MISVLSPREVLGLAVVDPALVVKVDNLIANRFDGVKSRICLDELPEQREDPWYSSLQDIYRSVGWKVEVDKPGYGSKQKEALIFSVDYLH